MKKMTIALFTAAAMGTTGAAMAEDHGPNFSGDLRVMYNDNAGDDTEDALSTNRLKLGVSGSADAINNTEAFYYFRFLGEDTTATGRDYAYLGLRGDFGVVQAGSDDDLVYKFAGARTDIFRGQLPGGGAADGAAGNVTYAQGPGGDKLFASAGESVQYSVDADALRVAAYANTADNDGIDTTQLAASFDFGAGNLAAVYSDRSGNDEAEVFGAATVSFNDIDVSGSIGRNNDDNNPVSLTVSGPLTNNVSFQLGYADDDVDTADTIGQVIVDLGGGLETFGSYRTGDSDDGFVAGAQYNF